MKISRIKKTIAALGLVLACTLGGFALSLAHDLAPADSAFSLVLRRGLPNGVSRLDDSVRQFRFELAAGDVPPSLQKAVVRAQIFNTSPTAAAGSSIRPRPYAPKIARHMLDSILLI